MKNSNMTDFNIKKRGGSDQGFDLPKLTKRLKDITYGLSSSIDIDKIAGKVAAGLYEGVTTKEIDELACETAAYRSTHHPDYDKLAARIFVSRLHKETSQDLVEVMRDLYDYINPKTLQHQPKVSKEVLNLAIEHAQEIESVMDYNKDKSYDYFALKTLERSYLLRIDNKVAERPQHMLMRVALGIHGSDIEAAIETYTLMSDKYFTHATPTLFNAGTPKPQLSSCFLLSMKDDSIKGIYNTLGLTADISQHAGGIGLSLHDVRSKGSYISGTGGSSNGIVPMLKVFNDTARYVDQGGGKRKGSFAMYLEPWHADIFEFLELKKNTGKEELRARDLFYAMWIPDLFMQRVDEGGDWTLMCPNECKGLADVHSEEFNKLYTRYEHEGKGRKTIKARELYEKMCESQIETGTPYMLYKDACNSKSNQKNLGTIRSSNLCTEIVEYTSPDEVAVCNLASIALSKFVVNDEFDHQKLFDVTRKVTRNLDTVIDVNYYPVEEGRTSNTRHRPIGIGVQGLADVFFKLGMPFTCDSAQILNRDIFETIYFAALTESVDLAIEKGTYETYKGSPISEGKLQFDMWGVSEDEFSGRWDWNYLRKKVKEYGVRNSLLVAPMPTASTSQILGNNECFEPITSNIYTRRVLAGEFIVVNRELHKDLVKRKLWNEGMRQKLMKSNGSVQDIEEIPKDLKDLYKTSFELSNKELLHMARDRAWFIDQSQSMNIFMENANLNKVGSMHLYAWKLGLKTGMYYLRTKAAINAKQFTLNNSIQSKSMSTEEFKAQIEAAKNQEGDDCLMCGS